MDCLSIIFALMGRDDYYNLGGQAAPLKSRDKSGV